MMIFVDSPLLELIKYAQSEGVREENWKIERTMGEITRFILDSHAFFIRCGWVWAPIDGF